MGSYSSYSLHSVCSHNSTLYLISNVSQHVRNSASSRKFCTSTETRTQTIRPNSLRTLSAFYSSHRYRRYCSLWRISGLALHVSSISVTSDSGLTSYYQSLHFVHLSWLYSGALAQASYGLGRHTVEHGAHSMDLYTIPQSFSLLLVCVRG